FEEVNKDPQAEILVNLPDQFVEIKSTGNSSKFEINEYKKENLLNGFDDIDYLINIKSEIINFSKSTPL
ncbi:MAG: 3-isopropylmalate dehydratase small subunit, partial [Bacteroidota bacterium]|nr:3-isopropylmalate dehydratase small subunit [Bacteroidota bacterium]